MAKYSGEEKFKLVVKLKSFIISLEKIILTIPKKDMFTRNMIYQDALELYELVMIANYESRIENKKTYQMKALAKVNKIDFYIERAYKLGYIKEKQALKISGELGELNKMLYAWCRNEKEV